MKIPLPATGLQLQAHITETDTSDVESDLGKSLHLGDGEISLLLDSPPKLTPYSPYSDSCSGSPPSTIRTRGHSTWMFVSMNELGWVRG
jgi:hypothetical protein